MLSVKDVVVRFGGVVALDGPTFDVAAGRDLRADRAQRRRQDDAVQLRQPALRAPTRARSPSRARTCSRARRTRSRRWGSRARSRTSALAHVADRARERDARRPPPRPRLVPRRRRSGCRPRAARSASCASEADAHARAPRARRGRRPPRRRAALRDAQARRAGPRAVHAPEAAAARRAGRRPQPRRGRRRWPTCCSALRDEFDLTILLVEHHMGMVMRISDHVVVLDFGRDDRRRHARRGRRRTRR